MRRTARWAGAVALAAALTSCGSDGATDTASQSPAEVVRAASQQTVDEQTSRLEIDIQTKSSGMETSTTGEGVVDYAARTAQFSMTLPGVERELTVVALPDAIYMKGIPGQDGGTYLKIDLEQMPGMQGGGLSAFGSVTDPAAMFDTLVGAEGVTEVGPAEVRGEQTTQYRGSIAIADVTAAIPADRRDEVEKQLAMLREAGIDTIPFDAYVDEEGRLRRMTQEVTLDLSKLAGAGAGADIPSGIGSEMTVTTRVDLFDFGVDVDVTAPPADQVTDGNGLLGGA